MAIFFAICGAWSIMAYVLELPFQIIWPTVFFVIMGGLVANVLAGLYFAIVSLRVRPAEVLRAK
jgi:putative ABC transport system permease protein